MDPETLATEPTVIVPTEPTTPTTTEPVAPEPTTPEPTETTPAVEEPVIDAAAELTELRAQLTKQQETMKEREDLLTNIVDERLQKEGVTPEQKAILDGLNLSPDKKLDLYNQMKATGFFATKAEAPKVEIGSPYMKANEPPQSANEDYIIGPGGQLQTFKKK